MNAGAFSLSGLLFFRTIKSSLERSFACLLPGGDRPLSLSLFLSFSLTQSLPSLPPNKKNTNNPRDVGPSGANPKTAAERPRGLRQGPGAHQRVQPPAPAPRRVRGRLARAARRRERRRRRRRGGLDRLPRRRRRRHTTRATLPRRRSGTRKHRRQAQQQPHLRLPRGGCQCGEQAPRRAA